MEPFKEKLSGKVAKQIACAMQRSWAGFDRLRFLRGMDAALKPLELKNRMLLIADRLEACIPGKPAAAFDVICASLKQDESDGVGLESFSVWPLGEVVSRQGLADLPAAMAALREVTIRFTSEFAIRRFLHERQGETLAQMRRWVSDPNEHVRRLVSEGSRPLLPWGGNWNEGMRNPGLMLPLLDRLWNDPSEYVRRSVANHLNDFSKQYPALVIETLRKWKRTGGAGFESLANRAARTLLKGGDSGALEFFGFSPTDSLRVDRFKTSPKTIQLGETLEFTFRVTNLSNASVSVMFDYAIHHQKKDGRLTPKVFKGKVRTLAADESVLIEGRHTIRPITTRTYYPGRHEIELLLNGRASGRRAFVLNSATAANGD